MKLAVFNGSPRKSKSNSTLLMNHFSSGYYSNNKKVLPLNYLAQTNLNQEHIKAFDNADTVLLIFPLYTDAMPGQVKFFLESIADLESNGKRVGFIVQSGFPEAYHSIFIERYLKRLAEKQNWEYIGTVIKGGVEGIKIMPPSMTNKLFKNFYNLGKDFALTGQFNSTIVQNLRNPYRMSTVRRGFFRIMLTTGLANFYWNKNLKENNAYDKRFAQPYAV
ncbi:MAG: NAD(P)H-dependent oxidoreductase [Prolixibacteraceae bacterium]|jgi:hypothetical protein|nr:NAD(P)H-dependent oxidoreductase [Prolixibacteraceae bacterium]